jgi:DNA polymerase I-like protein with 3'-5' exonuclease and polymerase domains
MRQHKREIRSMYGRRILLDEALSLRELRGAFLNYPIQTTASDLLKVTMRNLSQGGAIILASVHDEILVAAPSSKLKQTEGLFREAVAQATRVVLGPETSVGIEIGIGRTWWEASLDAKQKKQQKK